MKLCKFFMVALAASLIAAGAAAAQAPAALSRIAQIELYDQPNYSGQRVVVRAGDDGSNLVNLGFNDRASSLRVTGVWEVCYHINFGGQCTRIGMDAATLRGLDNQISSVRLVVPTGSPPQRPIVPPSGGGNRPSQIAGGTDGVNSVTFFAMPRANGSPISQCEQPGMFNCAHSGANAICRIAGYREAIHYTLADPRRHGGTIHIADGSRCTGGDQCLAVVDLLCSNN